MKRLISLTAAIALMISILNISAYAYTVDIDYIYTSEKDAFFDAVSLIEAYSNGEISFEDFASDLTYVQGKAYTAGLDVAAVKIKQFIDICNLKFGADSSFGGAEHGGGSAGGSRTPITDLWSDICGKNNVPTETTKTPITDMPNGCGAYYIKYNSEGNPSSKLEADYLVLDFSTSGKFRIGHYQDASLACPMYGYSNGNWKRNGYAGNSGGSYIKIEELSYYKFYGDVRTIDGYPYPTDDEYEYGSIYNFEGLTDKELKDLIEQLADIIQQEYPDLSTVEGLLNAIYGRLGTLDSDDDNALLSAINAAIISLATDTQNNNSEIIEVLKDLKKATTEGSDLDPILKELKDVNKSLDYLKAINTLDLIGDTIETLLELTETETKFLVVILFLCAVLRHIMTAQPLNCQEITNYVVVKTVFDIHFSLDNDIICDIMTVRL